MKKLFQINWLKTIYFNLHYFPLRIALKMPVFVYFHTRIKKMKGHIELNTAVRPGIVRLGQDGVGTIDKFYERTVWADWGGYIIINGQTGIGRGGRICVGQDAQLSFGDNFTLSGRSSIICMKAITFGKDCLLSWDILMMDTDFHRITDENNKWLNMPRNIEIGNHVWIGCRATIMKGVRIADNSVIAGGSTITKSINDSNSIYAGNGKDIRIIRNNINWSR